MKMYFITNFEKKVAIPWVIIEYMENTEKAQKKENNPDPHEMWMCWCFNTFFPNSSLHPYVSDIGILYK